MDILVLGCGNIGKVIAYDLSKDFRVHVGDSNENKLVEIQRFADPVKIDVTKHEQLIDTLRDFNLIIDALPGNLGFMALKAAIRAKRDIVSVSFMPENPLTLVRKAKQAQISIIPDVGFAPGISNICVGWMSQTLEELDEVIIRVGGLPKNPQPPLYYQVTWSPTDLIEEYMRKARIVQDGKVEEVDPLTQIETVEVGGEEFEEFVNDGLRTLLTTVTARHLEERTLRWPGHLERMRILKTLGFLDEKHRKYTLKVILPQMKYESEDFSIMEVKGRGNAGRKTKEVTYFLYDEERQFSSMARTTGFTAAIVSRLASKDRFGNGVIPPETFDISTCETILSELQKRGVEIERSVETV